MFRRLVPLGWSNDRRAALRLLMLVISLGFWACGPQSAPARAGVLDLRGADFSQGAVRLGGLWELYPGELRPPSQLPPGQPGDTPERLATNESWRRHRLTTGATLPAQGALTLRLRVVLPARGASAEPWVLKAGTRARAMRVYARDRAGTELMQPLTAGMVSTDLEKVRGSKRTLIAPLLPPAVSADGEAAELELVGIDRDVELLQRTRSGETKVTVAPHGLPGKLGSAAVPTGDVGLSCGRWDHLAAGWVSQDGKTYLFKLGATLGGRCDTAPTPVEYCSWVSP